MMRLIMRVFETVEELLIKTTMSLLRIFVEQSKKKPQVALDKQGLLANLEDSSHIEWYDTSELSKLIEL